MTQLSNVLITDNSTIKTNYRWSKHQIIVSFLRQIYGLLKLLWQINGWVLAAVIWLYDRLTTCFHEFFSRNFFNQILYVFYERSFFLENNQLCWYFYSVFILISQKNSKQKIGGKNSWDSGFILVVKVHIFWEGRKICKIFTLLLTGTT